MLGSPSRYDIENNGITLLDFMLQVNDRTVDNGCILQRNQPLPCSQPHSPQRARIS
jgi:hypothetical protein